MRRAFKNPDSKILSENLQYNSGNSASNKKIAAYLLDEQKKFCAYTDEYISRTDAGDIEHFNPTLKDTPEDNYQNWFIVKHQWNIEKSNKWNKFQPILHPTAVDFETRIVYLNGDYIVAKVEDTEAINLISLLQLDDPALAEKRKKYIARKRSEIEAFGQNATDYFSALMHADPCQLSYSRAIKEEFAVDILQQLS